MPTSKISLTEGSGKNMATHSITEDAVTKEIQRVVASKSDGSEVDLATQTTLAAILAKIISSPATEATLASILSKLNASLAVTGTFYQATQPISGSVSVSNLPATQAISAAGLPLPTGAAIAANQQTDALTNAQIRATPLPISGTVSTGLSQPLTDTQLRATALPVSVNNFPASTEISNDSGNPVPISGTVSTGLSQPLTDTQLRATPVPISGTVSTGLSQPLTDAQLRASAITANETSKTTYKASTIIPLVTAVTANVPFLNIIGSATKTISIKKISVNGHTLTAVAYTTINVEKLSTASTGGTSTTLVAVPLDSTNAAPTAVVKAYTVAPTKGTLVGTVSSQRILSQATVAAAAGVTADFEFKYGDFKNSTPIVLRGVAQEVCLTYPVALASAATCAIDIEWTEE